MNNRWKTFCLPITQHIYSWHWPLKTSRLCLMHHIIRQWPFMAKKEWLHDISSQNRENKKFVILSLCIVCSYYDLNKRPRHHHICKNYLLKIWWLDNSSQICEKENLQLSLYIGFTGQIFSECVFLDFVKGSLIWECFPSSKNVQNHYPIPKWKTFWD
jgi:hypothetical protein